MTTGGWGIAPTSPLKGLDRKPLRHAALSPSGTASRLVPRSDFPPAGGGPLSLDRAGALEGVYAFPTIVGPSSSPRPPQSNF